jgi:hypothetical protein
MDWSLAVSTSNIASAREDVFSATAPRANLLGVGLMSPEQPVAVAEPSPASSAPATHAASAPFAQRRRIVSAPQRTALPVALIVRERGTLPSLEAQLQQARPVVVFPSLSHFCTESHRSERWGGIVIARACAWDARLDDYVLHRECMALYGEAEDGYGWPESVQRLRDDGVAGWLGQLDVPRVRLPPAKPRRVRPAGEAAPRKKSRAVFSLWKPAQPVSIAEPAEPAAHQPVAAPSSESGKRRAAKVELGARARGRVSTQQTLPFVETRAVVEKPAARRPRGGRTSVQLSKEERRALAHAAGVRAPQQVSFGQEERLARMGIEIGLTRAYELLDKLRARARELARATKVKR